MGLACGQPHDDTHAGQEHPIGVGNRSTPPGVARRRVDLEIHRVDLAAVRKASSSPRTTVIGSPTNYPPLILPSRLSRLRCTDISERR